MLSDKDKPHTQKIKELILNKKLRSISTIKSKNLIPILSSFFKDSVKEIYNKLFESTPTFFNLSFSTEFTLGQKPNFTLIPEEEPYNPLITIRDGIISKS